MITTVTLNASVDKAYIVAEEIQCGTVMRVAACRNTAGGKGLNVARVAKLCGAAVKATGFVGGNTGKQFLELLEKDTISGNFVEVEGETRCCINLLEPEGRSTEFLEPGNPVSKEEIEKFFTVFRGLAEKSDVITLSGSVPKGTEVSIYKTLIEIAKEYGKKVILDTSGSYLQHALEGKPTLVKPNQEELSAIWGKPLKTKEEIIEAGKALQQKGIPFVVISMGKDGALLFCEEGIFHGIPPKLTAVNTVGCGDAMVAGFAVALEQGMTTEKMLQYAVAVSAANAMTAQTGSFQKEDFAELLKKTKVVNY